MDERGWADWRKKAGKGGVEAYRGESPRKKDYSQAGDGFHGHVIFLRVEGDAFGVSGDGDVGARVGLGDPVLGLSTSIQPTVRLWEIKRTAKRRERLMTLI